MDQVFRNPKREAKARYEEEKERRRSQKWRAEVQKELDRLRATGGKPEPVEIDAFRVFLGILAIVLVYGGLLYFLW